MNSSQTNLPTLEITVMGNQKALECINGLWMNTTKERGTRDSSTARGFGKDLMESPTTGSGKTAK